jgi:hypothetical protein
MSAIIEVGEERVWMSSGTAEDLRRALAAWYGSLEPQPPERDRVVDYLENWRPSDLCDRLPPFDDPGVHAALAPGWLLLAHDVAIEQPRWVTGPYWQRMDRPLRILWVANVVRIARAWSGVDPSQHIAADWSDEDKRVLAAELTDPDGRRLERRSRASR